MFLVERHLFAMPIYSFFFFQLVNGLGELLHFFNATLFLNAQAKVKLLFYFLFVFYLRFIQLNVPARFPYIMAVHTFTLFIVVF